MKINLVDYLENHLVSKLKQSVIDWEELTGEKTAEKENHMERRGEPVKKKMAEEISVGKDETFSIQEEAELEELLKEFFV